MVFCFTLTELSSRWKCTENDVLGMAIDGKLKLSVNLNGYTHPEVGDTLFFGWVELMLPSEISGFLPNKEDAYFTTFHRPSTPDCDFIRLKTHSGEIGHYHLNRSDVVVMNADVICIEVKHPELIAPFNPEHKRPAKGVISANAPAPREVEAKTPFYQAIEKLYRYLYDRKEYDALKPECVNDFIKVLDGVIKQDGGRGGEFDNSLVDYIAERIEKVKFSRNGGTSITTTEIETEGPNGSKNIHKANTYKKLEVTKKLCLLRKRYSLPL